MTSFSPNKNNHWNDRPTCSCKIQNQCMCYNLQACDCGLECECEDCDDMQSYLIITNEEMEKEVGCPCGGNCQCGQWDSPEYQI